MLWRLDSARADGDQVVTCGSIRVGSADDTDRLLQMHVRCTADTISRRYHAVMPALTPREARAQLEPEDGWSCVAMVGEELVAIAMAVDGGEGIEVGLLVEDRWQGCGVGARLFLALAGEAVDRGVTELACDVQPGTERAVLATIRRAGFTPRAASGDPSRLRVAVGRRATGAHGPAIRENA
jgi:GNAT superfamily N-acetyltransferase